jgi:predicted nucleotidyltransferase
MDMHNRFCEKKESAAKLWNELSKVMLENGHNANSEACRNKFNNLKGTYHTIKKRLTQTGQSSTKWQYYEQFNEMFSNQASINPPPENIASTVNDVENEPIDEPPKKRRRNAKEDYLKGKLELEKQKLADWKEVELAKVAALRERTQELKRYNDIREKERGDDNNNVF